MDAPDRPLRRGWTTGTCATAAAKAAYVALVTDEFPDPVAVTLPRGDQACFALATTRKGEGKATAGVIKDAGDDPDVTHGALILATVQLGAAGSEIAIPGGEALARRTLNSRLGIVGGLSILGTTGIVVPYSCSSWIHSIHRGIDVARAAGLSHIAGSTGAISEEAVRKLHDLPDIALIDMGDFVGGMLKYLRTHPVERVTIADGVAKMAKLAQGLLDLHSKRGSVDLPAVAARAAQSGGTEDLRARIVAANTVADAFAQGAQAGVALGDAVARAAWDTAAGVIVGIDVALEIVVFDRDGRLVGRAPFAPAHDLSPTRKRRR